MTSKTVEQPELLADELGELALKHGVIEVDLAGDGLAWRLPGSGVWTALRTPTPQAAPSEEIGRAHV